MSKGQPEVREVRGTITLADGTVSEFRVSKTDLYPASWQQWGANNLRLGATVDLVEAITNAVRERQS